jgi:NAD(P)-dependent dehydrogenase (short-subunit alcohol dehydrogenase family)
MVRFPPGIGFEIERMLIMPFPPANRTVLITGCSSGIGLATAVMLAGRGWRVFPAARQPADVDRLAAQGFEAIRLDVADPDACAAAVARALALTDGKLGALVNNAGMAHAGAIEDLPREAMRHQLEINVVGAHDLSSRLVPAFRAQRAGRIVNVSSVLGRVTLPFMGAYCASKHALECLSDALRIELHGSGVAVSIVEPGPIITAFRTNSIAEVEKGIDLARSRFGDAFKRELERRRRSVKKAGFMNKPPEAVAAKIVHALESPRPHRRYCVAPAAYAGAWLRRVAPDCLLDALLVPRVARMHDAEPQRRRESAG